LTRRRLFQLLRDYKKDPDSFSIQYERKRATRKITEDVEKNILTSLNQKGWAGLEASSEAFWLPAA